MLKASYTEADSDKDRRALREQQVDADRLLLSLRQAMIDDGERLLSADEVSALIAGIEQLQLIRDQSQDARTLELAVEQLAKASDEFASRRMDASIQRALQGHTIEEIEEGS